MNVETPDHVTNRVVHELDIPPGAIARRHKQDRDTGEWEAGDWFAVLTHPKRDSNDIGEQITVVFLDGDKQGHRRRYFLGDLGVQPPHRSVCEKHDLQIPERYVFTSWIARSIRYAMQKLRLT